MQKDIPQPVIIAVIVLVVLIGGFFLYKAATGGQVGEGAPGRMGPSPPKRAGDPTPLAPPGYKGP